MLRDQHLTQKKSAGAKTRRRWSALFGSVLAIGTLGVGAWGIAQNSSIPQLDAAPWEAPRHESTRFGAASSSAARLDEMPNQPFFEANPWSHRLAGQTTAAPTGPASPAGPASRSATVVPDAAEYSVEPREKPEAQDPARHPEPAPRVPSKTIEAISVARRMLEDARQLAARGDVFRARHLANQARRFPVKWSRDEESPAEFLARLDEQTKQNGEATVTTFGTARSKVIYPALSAEELDAVRRLPSTGDVPPATSNDGPSAITVEDSPAQDTPRNQGVAEESAQDNAQGNARNAPAADFGQEGANGSAAAAPPGPAPNLNLLPAHPDIDRIQIDRVQIDQPPPVEENERSLCEGHPRLVRTMPGRIEGGENPWAQPGQHAPYRSGTSPDEVVPSTARRPVEFTGFQPPPMATASPPQLSRSETLSRPAGPQASIETEFWYNQAPLFACFTALLLCPLSFALGFALMVRQLARHNGPIFEIEFSGNGFRGTWPSGTRRQRRDEDDGFTEDEYGDETVVRRTRQQPERRTPARQTSFVDPTSPDTPAHLLPPMPSASSLDEQRQREEEARRTQEEAILREIYQKNLEFREQLRSREDDDRDDLAWDA